MNKGQLALKTALRKGYKWDGEQITRSGRVRKLSKNKSGYFRFSIRLDGGASWIVFVHRLVAYIKYGDSVFVEGMQVRHLNGNKTDNSYTNIAIGTASENNMDKPESVRMAAAIKASMVIKKYDHDLVRKYYQEKKSYKKTMEHFNIQSKGTVHFILNKTAQ